MDRQLEKEKQRNREVQKDRQRGKAEKELMTTNKNRQMNYSSESDFAHNSNMRHQKFSLLRNVFGHQISKTERKANRMKERGEIVFSADLWLLTKNRM